MAGHRRCVGVVLLCGWAAALRTELADFRYKARPVGIARPYVNVGPQFLKGLQGRVVPRRLAHLVPRRLRELVETAAYAVHVDVLEVSIRDRKPVVLLRREYR